jgi:phage terminase small subunit
MHCVHPKNRQIPTDDPLYVKCEVCQEVIRAAPSKEKMLIALDDISKRLTPSRKHFCHEYLSNGENGTQAYLSVFKTKNYAAAGVGASRLLKDPKIRAYIDLMKATTSREVLDHLTVTKERILDEEAKIAFADVRQMFDENGCVLPLNRWPEELARCVDGVDITERTDPGSGIVTRTFKYRLNNKGQALQRLQKCLGMHVDTFQLGEDFSDALFKVFDKVDGKTRGVLPMDQEDE